MDCQCLIHPFQNDPGTSQRQRVMDNLLSGAAKIDARTLADLLDYFVQMSRHINYYDLQLNVNDWQPFFKNSVPFTLASIIKFPLQNTETSLALYKCIFDKKPSPAGLQLNAFSIYYRFINSINNWHLTLKDSSLPIAATLEGLIKNKLQDPVKRFIQYTNAAVKTYGIKRIDFLKLSNNPVWGLDTTTLSAIDTSFSSLTISARQRLINLYTEFSNLLTVFNDEIKTLSAASENNLERSFIPLKEELQKKHQPHLALLFAFLNMFRQLQNDLNQYTRKHLDYFYKDILKFQSEEALPDKANIVFEIQKLLKNYLIKKGLRVKDGKDDNKQDILFSLNDDIVVTQTTIADKRTLFLNNQIAHAQTYVEGVYMAPVADMADGVDKAFPDDPKNFPTLGARFSKYTDPESKLVKPYPNARLGFILASPVLSLQAGSIRVINVHLSCILLDSICGELGDSIVQGNKNCCNDQAANPLPPEPNPYPNFLRASRIYQFVKDNIKLKYIYLSEDIFRQAMQKGFTKDFVSSIRERFLLAESAIRPCYCEVQKFKPEESVLWTDWDFFLSHPPITIDEGQRKLLDELFPPQKILNLRFSGEKDWIVPGADDYALEMDATLGINNTFSINITATLPPETGSIVNFNKDNLKEDFGTVQPLVKIQLNDRIKLEWEITPDTQSNPDDQPDCCGQVDTCCLSYEASQDPQIISYYHFFRNVLINQPDKTFPVIQVDVCGLKNFIVQNDETVMDVNGPVYPFGTRPDIINFDINNIPGVPPLTGPGFYIGSEEIFFKKWDSVRIHIKWKDKPADFNKYYEAYVANGLNEADFHIQISALDKGKWIDEPNVRPLFADSSFWIPPPATAPATPVCVPANPYDYAYHVYSKAVGIDRKFIVDQHLHKKLETSTLNGFLKISLQDQDFFHKDYAFVLARQMMAFGRYPDLINGAIYITGGIPAVFDISIFFGNIGPKVIEIATNVLNSAINGVLNDLIQIITDKIDSAVNKPLLNGIIARCITLLSDVAALASITITVLFGGLDISTLTAAKQNQVKTLVKNFISDLFNLLNTNLNGIEDDLKTKIKNKFNAILGGVNINGIFTPFFGDKQVVIPNEPWTPVISQMELDYSAIATIDDIDLIHLYPYNGTYKEESINLQPTLFPEFCDEGSLFLGLKDLVPGDNLNILFQLAEATSDSESDKEPIFWQYLDTNVWKPLRTGFEVLDDATNNLTSSGIIKFALPANMTKENTVMPKDLHWIKASIPKNSGSVSETLGILTQAIQVSFTNESANDKWRLSKPLASGSISKLEVADASIKTVTQPYDSFGGLVPEIQQQFYVRVSETLRHKGRAIQAFDYERLTLQAFPQLFKAKCINHSFALNAHEYKNDFPYAGGYVLLAVIPDLNQLKAGNSFEPKVPVSIIEDIDAYIRKRTSPFVRFRAMNPRYEKINFCLRIRLLKGKDENYYKEKVQEDIREFLAPWSVGDYYKLTFGQCIYRSDIIQFLETRDYMDYISDLQMGREGEKPDGEKPKVCPDTPRSILIAGDIEVCIDQMDCESWGKYYACDDKNPLLPCDTKLEKISDYCK